MNKQQEQYDVMECVMRLVRLARRHPPKGKHSHSMFRLMRLVASNEGATARTLADQLGIRPPSLSEQLDRLEERGMVRRVRDAQDARVVRVCLTDEGRAEIDRHADQMRASHASVNALLSEEERQQFCALCNKMIGALEGQDKEEDH